jgi:biopolymer transport protein ExbB/TolQ
MDAKFPQLMNARCTGMALLLAAATVMAQAPVEDLASREQAIQRSQQATGAAYRDLQQAQYESKLAEQELLNAQEADRVAQQHAQERRQQLDAAKKAHEAAKAKEAQARKRYDQALAGVDRAFEKPPVK